METKEKIEHFLKDVKVWSFNVKFNATDSNVKTFKEFKEFCKENTDNNYLLGIRKLLGFYKADYKYQSLYDLIEELQVKTNQIEHELIKKDNDKKEKEERPTVNTFGKKDKNG